MYFFLKLINIPSFAAEFYQYYYFSTYKL